MKKACFYLTLFLLVVGWTSLAFAFAGAFQISTTPGEDSLASIAFDGTNYFVVWENFQASVRRVYGARVTKTGTVLDPNGLLIADPGGLGSVPSVAFDGTNYLVVWYTGGTFTSAIYGARVSVDGKILDPGGIPIASPTQGWGLFSPSVAFNGTNYLVVWDQTGCMVGGIFGARVAPDGTVLDKPPISISRPDGIWICLQLPSVASDKTDFLLAWEAINGQNRHVRGSRISALGGVLDPNGIDISTAPGTQFQAATDFDGINYMVVWTDSRNGNEDVFGARVAPTGSVLDPNGIAIVTDPATQYSPALAFDGKNHLVVWADLRNGLNQVWGADVSPAGTVLQPNGFQIFAGTTDAITRHVAFSSLNGLVVWENCYTAFCSDSDTYGMLMNLSP